PVGGLRARTAATLGRTMAATGAAADGLRGAVLAFADVAPENGIGRALSLELDLDDGNGGRVARALAAAAHVGPDVGAAIIAEHAQSLEGGSRAAVLLTEAALRVDETGEEADSEALLRRAAESDPGVPLAHHLGERLSRAREDRAALVEWIRSRREASQDALEQAYDLVREGMILAGTEPATAASLLEQALRARPKDTGLRELFERLSPEPPPD